ncbi:bifunctional helix-turn-helix domain-containing protein/methylated-DNA--[protein]-cysteine S-methyltransferase [Dysgonomonas massiliensis]|uniref:bifunctional helix-turn-helix domain-containing protein/methylated-DNA--[protein]-cysteine S-methyltransferase n=1 Tax=Dysgonomonas massiliensis TaxID=2040292 RepID=UPI000C78DE45|nr:methylated-DNA--[protein]-cysteine S-methyltransferase [Dysgonomonas massiliensis]
MDNQCAINFERISKAIEFINSNYKNQPSLNDVAEQINLSPYHFQKLFTEWAGVSPKQFLQYISLSHAKDLLKHGQSTLFEASYEIGLSGTSRLHDLFVSIEGMTPGEYKNGGENLKINYDFDSSPFGEMLIASTTKGICHMAFVDNRSEAISFMKSMFPNAEYNNTTDVKIQDIQSVFDNDWSQPSQLKLHVKGTDFQLKVWETLLRIPIGEVVTYGDIAKKLDNPKASRAIGSAVGSNPIAYLIPCHRVIQSTGLFGQYHWGSIRKTAIIGWESAQNNNTDL